MTDRLENIDDLFRSRLYDYAPVPPAQSWERLEKELIARRKNRVYPLLWKVAAGFALLVGLSVASWKYFEISDHSQMVVNELKQDEASAESQEEISEKITSASTSSSTSTSIPTSTSSSERIESINSGPKEVPAMQYAENPENNEFSGTSSGETIVEETEGMIVSLDPINSGITDLSPETGNEQISLRKQEPVQDKNDLIIQQNLLALAAEEKNTKESSWSIGGHVGPQYSYRNANVNSVTNNRAENFNDYESGILAYAGGIKVETKASKRIIVQSGVYYSKIGFSITDFVSSPDGQISIDSPFEPGLNGNGDSRNYSMVSEANSTGTLVFDKAYTPTLYYDNFNGSWLPGKNEIEQYMGYIEIPFVVRYLVIDKKLDVNLAGGLWTDILVGNQAYLTNGQVTYEGSTRDLKTFSYSSSVSLGFIYPVSSNLSINFEPYFRYFLSPINTNPQTKVYPYTTGILTGISYFF